jgi:hypothetical protein
MRKAILLACIIILFSLSGCKHQEQPIPNIEAYIKIADIDSEQELTNMTYEIYGNTNRLVMTNLISKAGWNKQDLPINETYDVWCCVDNKDYYSNRHSFQADAVKWITCHCIKKEEPLIEINPSCLEPDEEIRINMNVSTQSGMIQNFAVCEKHSSGIDYAKFGEEISFCTSGWDNCMNYDKFNKCNETMPQGQYLCDGKIAKCDSVIGKNKEACFLSNMEIPKRLPYNKCFDVNLALKGESKEVMIDVKTNSFLSSDDFINITIIDKDLIADMAVAEGQQRYITEDGARDVGQADKSIVIKRC